MKRVFLSAILLALLITGPTTHAQEGLTNEQREALNTVNAAINNLMALDSYTVSGQTNSMQNVHLEDAPEAEITTAIAYENILQLDTNHQLENAQGYLTSQITNADLFTVDLSSEFIVTEGNLYERYQLDHLSRGFVDKNNLVDSADQWWMLSYDDLRSIYALEHEVSLMAFQQQVMPLIAPLEGGYFSISGGLPQPIEENMILNIVELDRDEINGQEMRVFEIQYDPMPMMIENIRTNPMIRTDPTEGINPVVYAALAIQLREVIDQRMTVWIGVEDGLIHYNSGSYEQNYSTREIREAVPALEDSGLGFDHDLIVIGSGTSTTAYSDFNVPLTITAPAGAFRLLDELE
jgi:hypothetical protein